MAGVDISGAKRKIFLLRHNAAKVAPVVRDAAAFYVDQLVDNILNGNIVNVISGNLKRSYNPVRISPLRYRINQEERIAPYAVDVNNRKRYMDALHAFWDDYVDRKTEGEIRKMIELSNKGATYNYSNPF